MTTTISYDTTTFTPTVVDGWSEAAGSANVVHRLVGGGIEVTHEIAAPRTFTLQLVFPFEADAAACADLHRTAPYIDLVSDDRALVNGRYVLAEGGQIRIDLDDETRDVFVLTIDAQEIP